jgi:transcriptional regulator with XRE-family HTH domain
MKIRKLVLLAIRGSRKIKTDLMAALDISQPTLSRFLNDNDENLTKAAALKVIREELGLTDDEILDEDTVKQEQN